MIWLWLAQLALGHALEDGLLASPPMGYNTWNTFGCGLNQEKLLKSARVMKELGLQELGYRYFVVDDCWMDRERTKGLQADAGAFPLGMKAFGDELHRMDFLFGIYTCRGVSTCEGRPSSRDHEEEDAAAFAAWGVDYVKNDACWDPDCGPEQSNHPGSGVCSIEGRQKAVLRYKKMEEALNRTGRRMVYSLAGWQPWFAPVGRSLAHLWRVGADVKDWDGVYEATRLMEQLRAFHGLGGWNDPDMLLGSSPGATLKLTPLQSRAQFSLWALFPAPLMLGTNLLELSPYDALTYSNLEVLAINQDPLVSPAEIVYQNCPAYPRFILEQGQLTFQLDTHGVKDPGVICGAHSAPDCASCCQGHGEGWCHGDCEWRGDGKSEDCKSCVLSEKAKRKPPAEHNPNPWQRKDLKESSQHQCQQVWMRRMSTGEVVFLAVNFASKEVTLELPLSQLRLPWGDEIPSLALDLWRPASAQRQLVAHLKLVLEANGGHRMLKLEAKGVEEFRAKDFKEVSLRASRHEFKEPELAPDWSVDGTGFSSVMALLVLVVLVTWLCRGGKTLQRLD